MFRIFQDPCLSGSIFFSVQVFPSPSCSRSKLFWVQVFQGPDLGFRMEPGFSGSASRFRVQGQGSGFRSSRGWIEKYWPFEINVIGILWSSAASLKNWKFLRVIFLKLYHFFYFYKRIQNLFKQLRGIILRR